MMLLTILCAAGFAQTDAAKLAEIGIKHLEGNRYDAAQTVFLQSLKIDPLQYEALSGLGFVHYSSREFAEARKYLTKAVSLRPRSFQSLFLLGATLVELKENQAAIEQLRLAHSLNPKHLDARKILASLYVENRKYGEAIALLQPVVNMTPYDEEVHLLLIEARQSSGDSSGAYGLAQQAWARFPRSAQVAAWLGFQLQFAARYAESKELLKRAIELDSSFPIALQILGEVHLKEENYEQAVVWLRRAADQMPADADTLLSLSRALVETAEMEKAIEVLQQASRAAPKDSRVHYHLSRLYFRMGDEQRASAEAAIATELRETAPAGAQFSQSPRIRGR